MIFNSIRDLCLPLRICAVTDGSITYLLEAIFKGDVEVQTITQKVVKADEEAAKLLKIKREEPVNHREVTLAINNRVYVFAKSLSPINRMPPQMREELMQADIPIGKILRSNRLETRRDLLEIERTRTPQHFPCETLSRKYVIIHNDEILLWINEIFPIDDRWNPD
ncbi:Chorismate pyruvate-lyase [Candidatus Methanoperedenaceae archaeon GB50]|nr:MAG: Chorismate pyruvate-lyase [Candidatus Methanoperedenaceae archaeon GB50]CAD7777192.1 Chorismate pyruvate-lyase [Candidatus Methanoperedenaceae archaeon GB37]CAD7777363.1 Chorismate pyruvate-lyase [Candidatus Methanoperedenaceae archaeon GB50]